MCQQTINRFGDLLRIQRLQKVVHRIQPEGVRGATSIPRGEDQTRGLRKHGQLRSERNAIFARRILPTTKPVSMGFGRMTAKAEIPPANGNQINDWPEKVQSVTRPFNFDPGSWRAIAFIYYLRYNNIFHSNNALLK